VTSEFTSATVSAAGRSSTGVPGRPVPAAVSIPDQSLAVGSGHVRSTFLSWVVSVAFDRMRSSVGTVAGMRSSVGVVAAATFVAGVISTFAVGVGMIPSFAGEVSRSSFAFDVNRPRDR